MNLFRAYRGLGDNKEALKFAFRYLYDRNWNSFEEVIEVIKKEYTKKEIKKAFNKIKNNVIVEQEIRFNQVLNIYQVKFLDFTIPIHKTFQEVDAKKYKEARKEVKQYALLKHLKSSL